MHPPPLATALGRVPSGLFVLTIGTDRDATGMLASWVQQCSFEPPHVSVALRRDRPIAERMTADAKFALNQLAAGQTSLLAHFGKGFAAGEPAFTGIDIAMVDDLPPTISAALAHLQCVVVDRFPAGDHDLVIGRVVAGHLQHDGAPHVHIRKNGMHY